MSTPEGRYMRLESVVGQEYHHKRRPASGAVARFNIRKRAASSWVVLYPGQPAIGDRIRIRLAPGFGRPGGIHERWVSGVVVPADRRGDGQSVVSVSKVPVMRPRPPAPATRATGPHSAEPADLRVLRGSLPPWCWDVRQVQTPINNEDLAVMSI